MFKDTSEVLGMETLTMILIYHILLMQITELTKMTAISVAGTLLKKAYLSA